MCNINEAQHTMYFAIGTDYQYCEMMSCQTLEDVLVGEDVNTLEVQGQQQTVVTLISHVYR